MTSALKPERTYAIVVGIEKYGSSKWNNLHGPAHDAIRFSNWLTQRGVPAENIALLVSPQDGAQLPATTKAYQPATHQNIVQALTEQLRGKRGDLLLFFWGGHGIITLEGERRLFYADATESVKSNLDLNRLMAFWRTNYLSGFEHQILLVDTCANYISNPNDILSLPSQTFPGGGAKTPEQFVLCAARSGERAFNLNEQETGYFSKMVLTELAKEPLENWPPEMARLANVIEQQFVELRNAGQVSQTPVYYWHKNWAGSERAFSNIAATAGNRPLPPRSRPDASSGVIFPLATLLLDCPSMSQVPQIEKITMGLRSAIQGNISYSLQAKPYVVAVVRTCLNYEGGLQELLDQISFYEGNSPAFQEVRKFMIDSHLVDET